MNVLIAALSLALLLVIGIAIKWDVDKVNSLKAENAPIMKTITKDMAWKCIYRRQCK